MICTLSLSNQKMHRHITYVHYMYILCTCLLTHRKSKSKVKERPIHEDTIKERQINDTLTKKGVNPAKLLAVNQNGKFV